MANLTELLKVRLDAETKAALDRLAAARQRRPSELARIAIRDYLVREGELDEEARRGV